MLERTLVFVDTSYLLASFYNSWDEPARAQLEIDLREVCRVLDRFIVQQIGQPIQRQNWYDGIPDSGPHRYQRTLRTVEGVQLRAGLLIETGQRRTQKAVDTRLVADMVLAAVRQQCSDMVLVSGDQDMIPGVVEASAQGIRVHLYGFSWDSMSNALRHKCDSITVLDPREDFAGCMQITPLEGPIPPAVPLVRQPEPEDPQATMEPATASDRYGADGVADAETEAETEAETSAEVPSETETEVETVVEVETEAEASAEVPSEEEAPAKAPSPADMALKRPAPSPSMMAPRRRLQSRYVPLPNEVWASGGFQTPFDVGQQYATWWFHNVATDEQRDNAHVLSGGGLPSEVDRPLLQFACEALHEFTLNDAQRVSLRDGFHTGIRALLISGR